MLLPAAVLVQAGSKTLGSLTRCPCWAISASTHCSAAFLAGNMLTAISVFQQHWQELVEDLSTGGVQPVTQPAQGQPCVGAPVLLLQAQSCW
jgi:hypothetical protein